MASIHSLVKCSTLLISLFPCTGFTSPTLSPKSPKSPAIDRPACQSPSRNPLDGCPHGTLLVGPSAHYTTIQSAAASLPNDTSAATILIFPGNYTEQINVTRAGPTYLLGQTRNIKDQSANTVNVIWAAVAGTGDNAYTSTLTVAPNLNAALTESGPTGFVVPPNTPFGTTDFRAYNLNFINDFAPYSDGPSFALSMGYSNTGFYYCGFFSYQDTVCPSVPKTMWHFLTELYRSTLASWEVHTFTRIQLPGRQISSTASAQPGLRVLMFDSGSVEAASQHGRHEHPLSPSPCLQILLLQFVRVETFNLV